MYRLWGIKIPRFPPIQAQGLEKVRTSFPRTQAVGLKKNFFKGVYMIRNTGAKRSPTFTHRKRRDNLGISGSKHHFSKGGGLNPYRGASIPAKLEVEVVGWFHSHGDLIGKGGGR